MRVRGGRELRRTLKAAGVDLKDLRAVNLDVARVVAPVARINAPVRTGRLAGSIRTGATQRGAFVRAGRKGTVPYAGPIHFGWPKRHIRARPFITEAAESTEPAWTQLYIHHMNVVIDGVKGA